MDDTTLESEETNTETFVFSTLKDAKTVDIAVGLNYAPLNGPARSCSVSKLNPHRDHKIRSSNRSRSSSARRTFRREVIVARRS